MLRTIYLLGKYLGQTFNNTLQEKDVRKLFHELDINKNGKLNKKEIKKGLKKLKLPYSDVIILKNIT